MYSTTYPDTCSDRLDGTRARDVSITWATGCSDDRHAWGPVTAHIDGGSVLIARTCTRCRLDELAPEAELLSMAG